MRPRTLLAAFPLLLVPVAVAKYAPTDFGPMVVEAKVIATGRIEALSDETYTLAVERWIAGEPKAERLVIHRFQDWTCAERGRPYAKGERLMVFLEPEGKDGFAAIGAGCEGEVLLGDGGAKIPWCPNGVRGGELREAALLEAVIAYREGFRHIDEPGGLDAWLALLGHRNLLVAATAIDHLERERGYLATRALQRGQHPTTVAYPGEALAPAVVGLIRSGPPELRAWVARRICSTLAPEGAARAETLLAEIVAKGPPEARPAATLALAALQPEDPARHAAFFDALGDTAVNYEDRLEAVHYAAAFFWTPIARPFPLEKVGPSVARALRGSEEFKYLRALLELLHWRWGGESPPWSGDLRPLRDQWLQRVR